MDFIIFGPRAIRKNVIDAIFYAYPCLNISGHVTKDGYIQITYHSGEESINSIVYYRDIELIDEDFAKLLKQLKGE